MILCRESLAQRIDKAVFPFTQGGPLMHAVAAKAVALREAAQPEFQTYAAAGRHATPRRSPPGWPTRGCARSPAAPTPTWP